jgi:hypothetical protein
MMSVGNAENRAPRRKSMPSNATKHSLQPGTSRMPVSRRLALTGVLALGALGLGTLRGARAQGVHGFRRRMKEYKENRGSQPTEGWLDAIMPGRQDAETPDLAASRTPALLAATSRAVAVGAPTREYCAKRVNDGDGSLRLALESIQAMLPVTNALAKLAELNAVRLKEMAKLGVAFLQDCETACRLQADANPPCRECANACAAAIEECRKVIGA